MPKSHYHFLKKSLEKRNKDLKEKLVYKHKDAFEWLSNNSKQIAAGAMGSVMLLSSPVVNLLPDHSNINNQQFIDIAESTFVVSDLHKTLPDSVEPLTSEQEATVSGLLSKYFKLTVKPEMDGKRLNTTYGYIGLEQHLRRYPGDNMDSHFENGTGLFSSGMAPNRGGFGYFAPTKVELIQKAVDQEKYYIAVQTFLAPGFSESVREYINFFKFRKMIVVNPQNGRAVVAVIGDSGPAVWTGKHLGGSPEVMQYLERVDGAQKGAVLYFFIDDPDDKVPLGPIEANKNV